MIPIFSACLFTVILLCLFVSFLLIIYSSKTRRYNYLLAAFFIALAYPGFITALINSGYIVSLPHFYRTGHVFALSMMPISYLYIRSVVTNKPLTKSDLFHLIPAIVYIIDFFPFFMLSGYEKMEFMRSDDLTRKAILFGESQIFAPGFNVVIKYVQLLIYWIWQLYYVIKITKVTDKDFVKENGVWRNWLWLFVLSQLLIFFPVFKILIPGYEQDEITVFLFIGGFTGITSFLIFLFPQILYGVKGIVLFHSDKDNCENADMCEDSLQQNEYQYITKDKMKEIIFVVKKHLEENQSFLNPRYSLIQLSEETDIPRAYISVVINKLEQKNFNDFINSYRISHCVKLLKEEQYVNHTLEAIANKSGFNNRNTFTIAFKKEMGETPSIYVKNIKIPEHE